MGKATVESYMDIEQMLLGVAPSTGLVVDNVTTSGAAASSAVPDGAKAVIIFAEDTDVRVDVGVSVTAVATSRLLYAGQSMSIAFAIPHDGAYNVSIINA
jgi:hypothetical protein